MAQIEDITVYEDIGVKDMYRFFGWATLVVAVTMIATVAAYKYPRLDDNDGAVVQPTPIAAQTATPTGRIIVNGTREMD